MKLFRWMTGALFTLIIGLMFLAACAQTQTPVKPTPPLAAAPAPAPAPTIAPAPAPVPPPPPTRTLAPTAPPVVSLPLQNNSSNNAGVFASTPSVYVPDVSHAGQPLMDGILLWDATTKSLDVPDGQAEARFYFDFTNAFAGKVSILDVHPSCGCTTAQLPPTPWTLEPSQVGRIQLTVKIHGSGTLFKTVTVKTDQGTKMLALRINILPPAPMKLTEDEMQQGIQASRVDRQAVFRDKCADCHNKNLAGKYDHELFQSACAICHEAEHRATAVPDLHNLPVPTNEEFWRTWITSGKPGSMMPAFAQSQGGPLNDMQIASLARYLNIVNPTKVALPPVSK